MTAAVLARRRLEALPRPGGRTVRRLVLAAVLLWCLFIGWTVFYSPIDDWRWSLDQLGLRWWLEGTYNNRYAGNFFAVILTRSPLLKTLLIGGAMFLIPFQMALLAARGEEKLFLPLFLGCSAGILLMPSVLWRETYYWVSGFGNFVMPTLLFLTWLLAVRRVTERRRHLPAWSALLFALSLVLGLFVENLTLLFLGASLVLGLWAVREKGLRLPYWACLAGSALAAGIMFFNGVYSQLAQSGVAIDGYRELSFSLADGLLPALKGLLAEYVCQLLPRAFTLGIHMGLPMGVITAMGFWHSGLRPLCVLGAFPVAHSLTVMALQVIDVPWAIVTSAISWTLPVIALLVQREEGERKARRLLLYLAAPLALAPLAATSSLVLRHHFFPMVMVILVGADEAAPLLRRRWGTAGAALVLAGMMLYWGLPCAHIAGCTALREELTRAAADSGAAQLVLPTDRYQYTVWSGRNAYDPDLANCFREINQLDRDVTLIFLPPGSYETWPEITPEQWDARAEYGPSDAPLQLIP